MLTSALILIVGLYVVYKFIRWAAQWNDDDYRRRLRESDDPHERAHARYMEKRNGHRR